MIKPVLEQTLLSVPIPTLAVPAALIGVGFSEEDRLGLRAPHLSVQTPEARISGVVGLMR